MKELQRQRQRAKGVTLEPKGNQELEEQAVVEEEEDHTLESTFTAQTDAGDVDPNMLRYIEEQMKQEESEGDKVSRTTAEEEELYTTPAHLKGRVLANDGVAAEQEDAQRWLAGIMEVPLDATDKMATIEETELAKRKMMAQRNARKPTSGYSVVVPGNFNSNFHMHRKETIGAVKAKKPQSAAGGLPHESDLNAVQAFKRNERERMHR